MAFTLNNILLQFSNVLAVVFYSNSKKGNDESFARIKLISGEDNANVLFDYNSFIILYMMIDIE